MLLSREREGDFCKVRGTYIQVAGGRVEGLTTNLHYTIRDYSKTYHNVLSA